MATNIYSGTQYNVVGTRPVRHDGYEKVTGAAKYGADIQLSNMLYGKVLRSPHPHAILKSIDTTAAEALPGVEAVMTHKDFPIIEDQMIDLAETLVDMVDIADWALFGKNGGDSTQLAVMISREETGRKKVAQES